MSGDVQPRKRKDKKRKKEDCVDEPQSHFAADEHFHIHKDAGTGGNMCAKIVFFVLLGILVSLIGLVLFEHHGRTDLDIPVSESQFASYLMGWVDESPAKHEDDHAEIEESEEHDEHDDEHEEDHEEAEEHEDEPEGSEEAVSKEEQSEEEQEPEEETQPEDSTEAPEEEEEEEEEEDEAGGDEDDVAEILGVTESTEEADEEEDQSQAVSGEEEEPEEEEEEEGQDVEATSKESEQATKKSSTPVPPDVPKPGDKTKVTGSDTKEKPQLLKQTEKESKTIPSPRSDQHTERLKAPGSGEEKRESAKKPDGGVRSTVRAAPPVKVESDKGGELKGRPMQTSSSEQPTLKTKETTAAPKAQPVETIKKEVPPTEAGKKVTPPAKKDVPPQIKESVPPPAVVNDMPRTVKVEMKELPGADSKKDSPPIIDAKKETPPVKKDVPPIMQVKEGVPPPVAVKDVPHTVEVKKNEQPAADSKKETPPAKKDVPPAKEVNKGVPPPEAGKKDVPPAKEVNKRVPPPEAVKDVPPVKEVNKGVPPPEAVKKDVPPAKEVNKGVPPPEAVKKEVPPAASIKTNVPPPVQVKKDVPPVQPVKEAIKKEVPPKEAEKKEIPPVGREKRESVVHETTDKQSGVTKPAAAEVTEKSKLQGVNTTPMPPTSNSKEKIKIVEKSAEKSKDDTKGESKLKVSQAVPDKEKKEASKPPSESKIATEDPQKKTTTVPSKSVPEISKHDQRKVPATKTGESVQSGQAPADSQKIPVKEERTVPPGQKPTPPVQTHSEVKGSSRTAPPGRDEEEEDDDNEAEDGDDEVDEASKEEEEEGVEEGTEGDAAGEEEEEGEEANEEPEPTGAPAASKVSPKPISAEEFKPVLGADEEDEEEEELPKVKLTRPAAASSKSSKPSGEQNYANADITNSDDWVIRNELDLAEAELEEKPEAALQMFIALVAQYPGSPRAHYGKARALDTMAEKQRSNRVLENAIETYLNVLRLKSAVPDTLFLLAADRCINRMRFKGQHLLAVPVHKMFIERFPDDPNHRNQLAVTYLMVNRLSDAKQVLEETLDRWPKNGFAQVHYGFVLKSELNLTGAVEYLSKGIATREPGTIDGRFFFQLGDALMRLGRSDEAMKVNELGVKEGLFLSKYQRSLYNVDRLRAKPWWNPEDTPYAAHFKKLLDNWKVIQSEGLNALYSTKADLYKDEAENLKEFGQWKQLELFARGRKISANCANAPRTCKLIENFPAARDCRRGQVKFSVMHAGTHVWPHCGPTNCRLRAHLGLVVPPGTFLRVANETRSWEEGKLFIFDDSFEHEVWHNGTTTRLVLIIDVWHPDLTEEEKRTLPAI